MRKLLLAVFLFGAAPCWAQTNAVCTAGLTYTPVAFAYEELTDIGATAVRLTTSTYRPTTGPSAMMAFISNDAGAEIVRFRLDGVAVTDATGHQLPAGSSLVICGGNLASFSAISESGSPVTLYVTYFRAPTQ